MRLPRGGDVAYARVVVSPLPFGTLLVRRELPRLRVVNASKLPANVTVVASVRRIKRDWFAADVAVVRGGARVSRGTSARAAARNVVLRISPAAAGDELGAIATMRERAALRFGGDFHGGEVPAFCPGGFYSGKPAKTTKRLAGPGHVGLSPRRILQRVFAAACDAPVPGGFARRVGAVAAWGTWSRAPAPRRGEINYTVRANRDLVAFSFLVPEGSITGQTPPPGFACPGVTINFVVCEGRLARDTTSEPGSIALTPSPGPDATGNLAVTTGQGTFGPYLARAVSG